MKLIHPEYLTFVLFVLDAVVVAVVLVIGTANTNYKVLIGSNNDDKKQKVLKKLGFEQIGISLRGEVERHVKSFSGV